MFMVARREKNLRAYFAGPGGYADFICHRLVSCLTQTLIHWISYAIGGIALQISQKAIGQFPYYFNVECQIY